MVHSKEYLAAWRARSRVKVMLTGAKNRAKKNDLIFDLSEEDITLPTHCPVLGLELKYHGGDGSGFYPDSHSLDRIDNLKGYTKDNIRVISNRANWLKGDASAEELEKILEDARLLRHRN